MIKKVVPRAISWNGCTDKGCDVALDLLSAVPKGRTLSYSDALRIKRDKGEDWNSARYNAFLVETIEKSKILKEHFKIGYNHGKPGMFYVEQDSLGYKVLVWKTAK